jgi:hypothetical protein
LEWEIILLFCGIWNKTEGIKPSFKLIIFWQSLICSEHDEAEFWNGKLFYFFVEYGTFSLLLNRMSICFSKLDVEYGMCQNLPHLASPEICQMVCPCKLN